MCNCCESKCKDHYKLIKRTAQTEFLINERMDSGKKEDSIDMMHDGALKTDIFGFEKTANDFLVRLIMIGKGFQVECVHVFQQQKGGSCIWVGRETLFIYANVM